MDRREMVFGAKMPFFSGIPSVLNDKIFLFHFFRAFGADLADNAPQYKKVVFSSLRSTFQSKLDREMQFKGLKQAKE
jgi:hypothetical protein